MNATYTVVANKDGQTFGNIALDIPASITTKEQLRDWLLTDSRALVAFQSVMGDQAPRRTSDRTHGWVYATLANVKGTDSTLRVTPAATAQAHAQTSGRTNTTAPVARKSEDDVLTGMVAALPDVVRESVKQTLIAQRETARQALPLPDASVLAAYDGANIGIAAAQERIAQLQADIAAMTAERDAYLAVLAPVQQAQQAFESVWGVPAAPAAQ